MANRKNKASPLEALLILGPSIHLALAIGGDWGTGWIIFSVVLFVAAIALILIFYFPAIKGWQGERIVRKHIIKGMDKNDVLINDVIVPGDDGKTSQIDHVLISTKGIFVVETKNYSGRIYGKDSDISWTQVLAFGHTKNKVYSPVLQNVTHIKRLSSLFSNESLQMNNVVVFAQGNVAHIDSKYVYTPGQLQRCLLECRNGLLGENEVQRIAGTIKAYKEHPIETNKEHAEGIRVTQNQIEANICPRCGGELVLRHTRFGREFYGCSNYPKCKFTKKR